MTNTRGWLACSAVVFVVLLVLGSFFGLFGKNDAQNWQHIQSVTGKITIRDQAGIYLKKFATVTTYPRFYQSDWGFDADTGFGNVMRITFNDGGWANMNGSIHYDLPIESNLRASFHEKFAGNIKNAHKAVMSHLVNCFKVAGPVMSGSEHQSARKGEFYNLVNMQLSEGLVQTVKRAVISKDETDENGNPITVYVTEIVRDEDGYPVIAEPSPLSKYGIRITQFSIQDTEYDPDTLEQFRTKKQQMLAAESSKAKRDAQVQERLMIQEQKLKEKAEVEGEALKEKAVAVIEAQKRVEIAEAAKREAQEKQERQVIEAEALKLVAEQNLEAEKLNAEAVRIAASAEQERIELAGAITEQERVLAEIARDRDIGVAEKLANVQTPGVLIGGGEGGEGNVMGNLVNMFLLKNLGILKNTPGEVNLIGPRQK